MSGGEPSGVPPFRVVSAALETAVEGFRDALEKLHRPEVDDGELAGALRRAGLLEEPEVRRRLEARHGRPLTLESLSADEVLELAGAVSPTHEVHRAHGRILVVERTYWNGCARSWDLLTGEVRDLPVDPSAAPTCEPTPEEVVLTAWAPNADPGWILVSPT